MTNTAIAKRTWKETLVEQMPVIAEAMPTHIKSDRFQRISANAISTDAYVLKAMNENPRTVWSSLMTCAKDGLLPDGREAALVAYRSKNGFVCQYIPMISGILKLMRQSGEVSSLSANVVYQNDEFDYGLGDDEYIKHKPFLNGDRGQMMLAYAVLKTKDGGIYREVMPRSEIMAVKSVSKASNGPWNGPFEGEMWKKTVLRRLSKRSPVSTDILDVIQRDDAMFDFESVPHAEQPATLDMSTGEIIEPGIEEDVVEDAVIVEDEQQEPEPVKESKPITQPAQKVPPTAPKASILEGGTVKGAQAYTDAWIAHYASLTDEEGKQAFVEDTEKYVSIVGSIDVKLENKITQVL